MLGLRFCARAFSSCGKWGPLFIVVHGPLTIAASLVAEHRLQMRRLSSCGSWAQLLRGMWDLPRPGLEPVSSALAGRFSTTAPPRKPPSYVFWDLSSNDFAMFSFLLIWLFLHKRITDWHYLMSFFVLSFLKCFLGVFQHFHKCVCYSILTM